MLPTYSRSKEQIARARELRKGGNPAEGALWNMLKAKQLGGYKFVRQFPIGPYFADFTQRQHRLVIEIDGSQHVDCAGDKRRDEFMRQRGYSVLRLWSGDVLRNREMIGETILAALRGAYSEDIVADDIRFIRAG